MKTLNAIIYAVAIVLFAFIVGQSYVNRAKPRGEISVTGLGQINFTSDLIVWTGSFTESAGSIAQAYSKIAYDRKKVLNYLLSNGINKDDIVFDAVTTTNVFVDNYSPEGKYIGQKMVGYKLTEQVKVTSKQVEKVENVSREITELINKGINFYSSAPSYYYTKLADLKLKLIELATKDAKDRAQKIASNSNARIGKLLSASMGVFQITGQYSNEDYSWGGTFNTSSKNKTASITVHLEYSIK